MTRPLFTGSAIERAAICPASAALPRVDAITSWAEEGTVLHRFLEVCALESRDAALADAEEKWPEYLPSLQGVNLDAVSDLLHLTPELAMAYDFTTRRARILGRGIERNYAEVRETEIPCTLDLVGWDHVTGRGMIVDWKRGWSKRPHPVRNHQLRFGALCLARLEEVMIFDVDAQLVTWRSESADPVGWVAEYTSADIDMYELELAEIWDQVFEIAIGLKEGRPPAYVKTGDHCDKCPARAHCPAYGALIRHALSVDALEEHMRFRPLTPEMAARAYVACRQARRLIEQVEGACWAAATQGALHLGEEPDGRHRWLGAIEREGNEELDGDITFQVVQDFVRAVHLEAGQQEDAAQAAAVAAAGRAIKLVATKGDTEKAVKASLPRGKKEKGWETVLSEIRARGGAKRETKTDVAEYTTASQDPDDDPRPLKRKG